MKLFQTRLLIPVAAIIVMMFVSACGSSTTTGSSSTSTTSVQSTPTTSTQAATPTTAPTSSAVVQTATATVNGKSETILTDTHGITLYYFTPDTATKAACTGGCANVWPPLLYNGSGTPTSATTLTGTLSVVSSANGNQVLYNGHFLYTYIKDSAPGQTTGEGVGGKWFVATTSLGTAKSASGY